MPTYLSRLTCLAWLLGRLRADRADSDPRLRVRARESEQKEFVTVFPVCARTRASADRRRGVPENKPQQQLVLGGYKTMSLGIVSAQFANSPGKCGTDTHPKEVSKALNSDFVKKNATNYSSK